MCVFPVFGYHCFTSVGSSLSLRPCLPLESVFRMCLCFYTPLMGSRISLRHAVELVSADKRLILED